MRRRTAPAADVLVTPDEEIVEFFAKAYPLFYKSTQNDPRAVAAQEAIRKHKQYYIENCLWIRRKDGGQQQLLILNDAQLRYWNLVNSLRNGDDPVMVIILKARQMGLSTIVAADFFSDIVCSHNTSARVMAHNKATGELLFGMYRFYYDNLDERLKPSIGIGKREGTRLVFREGSDRTRGLNSEIEVLVPKEASSDGTGDLGRGSTSQFLHISELAFWSNPTASLSSLMHSFADRPNSKCIIESTAVRAGDFFHHEWNRANEGKSDFHPIFIPWFVHNEYSRKFSNVEQREKFSESLSGDTDSEYGNELFLKDTFKLSLEQLNWRRRTIRNKCHGDKRVFQSEYPCTAEEAFQYARGNFLDGVRMSVYLNKSRPPELTGDLDAVGVVSKPIITPTKNPLVAVWTKPGDEEPFMYAEYVIGVDVSENLPNRDHSAAVVLRRIPLKVVARLRGNDFRRPLTEEFCHQLSLLGHYFNNARILIEANSIGQEVIRRVRDDERYPRVLTMQELLPEYATRNLMYGIRTSSTTRKQLVSGLEEMFNTEELECYDRLLVEECQALAPDDHGKVKAPNKGIIRPRNESEAGYYDDLAFALAIAYYAHIRLPSPKTQEQIKRDVHNRDESLFDREYREPRDPNYAYLDWV